MKNKIITTIFAIALTGFVSVSRGYAEVVAKPAQTHKAHHTASEPTDKERSQMPMSNHGDMMANMDTGEMHSMMQECMRNHKDGKTCDQNMMQKCEAKMGKDECKKMMSQMKEKNMNHKQK